MHVDAELAREIDANAAERIVIAGIFPEGVVDRIFRIPIDLRWLHFLVRRVVNADVIFGQVIRLVLHERNQVLAHDRDRHRPERIEIDLHNLAVDVGRRPIGLADDRGVARNRNVVFDALDARRWNIDHHIARSEIGRQCLQPLDIDLELTEPCCRRHVQCRECRCAHHAIDGKAVACLEPAHRFFDIGVVNVVGGRDSVRIDITGRRKPRAQIDHARMAIADAQFIDRRHDRPAAARHDAVVNLNGLFGELRGRGRKRRRGGLRHADGAGGLIEILSELAVLAVTHQGVERRVFGTGVTGKRTSQGGGCGEPEHPPAARLWLMPVLRSLHGTSVCRLKPERASRGKTPPPTAALARLVPTAKAPIKLISGQ